MLIFRLKFNPQQNSTLYDQQALIVYLRKLHANRRFSHLWNSQRKMCQMRSFILNVRLSPTHVYKYIPNYTLLKFMTISQNIPGCIVPYDIFKYFRKFNIIEYLNDISIKFKWKSYLENLLNTTQFGKLNIFHIYGGRGVCNVYRFPILI